MLAGRKTQTNKQTKHNIPLLINDIQLIHPKQLKHKTSGIDIMYFLAIYYQLDKGDGEVAQLVNALSW